MADVAGSTYLALTWGISGGANCEATKEPSSPNDPLVEMEPS